MRASSDEGQNSKTFEKGSDGIPPGESEFFERAADGEDGTAPTVIDTKPNAFRQLAAGSLAALNGFRVGMALGFLTTGIPSFSADPGRPFSLTVFEQSVFFSVYHFAGIPASLMSGFVGRRFGRKRPFIILLVLASLTWLLIAYPVSPLMMIIGRAVQGFFSGFMLVVGQIYTAEIAHKSWRGMLLSILMTCAALGNLITYIIGSFVNWRILALLCGGVPLACGPFLCLLPESPTKLVQVGKEQEALEAMVWLRGNKYRQSETDIQDIKKHIDEAEARQPSYKEMLKFNYLKPVMLAALVLVFRQFTGYYPMNFYAVSIFQTTTPSINKYLATIILGIVTTLFTILSCLTVDKVGAKLQAAIAAAVTTVANAIVAVYFMLPDRERVGWLPFTAILTFMAAFSWGISTLQHIIIGELIPIQIREHGTGVLFAVALIAISLVTMLYEYMLMWMGEVGLFWFYCASCAVLTVFCLFVLPDTKGKTLRQIEEHVTRSQSKTSAQ